MSSNDNKTYPLMYTEKEIKRLEEQARQLNDSGLTHLIGQAKTCLEIGCGAGANLPVVVSANKNIAYTGIDLNDYAISAAKEKATSLGLNANFICGDATKIMLPDNSVDFVFIKLVLWSVGTQWEKVLSEAFRVLIPGGMLYCFEPDDTFLLFKPAKPAFQSVIRRWQEIQMAKGLNPFVGQDLFRGLHSAGFSSIKIGPFAKVSLGTEPSNYRDHLSNLQKIFLGSGAAALGFSESDPVWIQALQEISTLKPEDMLIETHFVATGRKGSDPE